MYVDFGNKEKVKFHNLRYLEESFLVAEISTFKCCLFGIEFKDEENYNKAFEYVTETIKPHISSKDKIEATIKHIHFGNVKNCITDTYTYEIVLRYPISGSLTNINVMLTKLGYAICKDVAIFQGESEFKKESVFHKKSLTPTKLEYKAQAFISNLPNPESTCNRAPSNSIPCKVTNAVTPNEIWVQMCVHSDDHYEAFQKILAEKYKKHENAVKNWKKDDFCVFKFSSIEFFRAKILERLSNGKYNILCLDDGNYHKNVVENKLFDLMDEFTKTEFMAKKCSLVGVVPIGSSNGVYD